MAAFGDESGAPAAATTSVIVVALIAVWEIGEGWMTSLRGRVLRVRYRPSRRHRRKFPSEDGTESLGPSSGRSSSSKRFDGYATRSRSTPLVSRLSDRAITVIVIVTTR